MENSILPRFPFLALPYSSLRIPSLVHTSLIALLCLALLLRLLHHLYFLKLPPGPHSLPLLGNLLQYPRGLTPPFLADLTRRFGGIFMLKLGRHKLVVVSSPELASEVLQTRGVEFGGRARDAVLDTITAKGKDLVFTDYGEHFRKVRRICTPPFFSGKAIQTYREAWEEEITMFMTYLSNIPEAVTSGVVVKDHLQLLMYNLVYRMMFSRRFTGPDDPLYAEILRLNANMRRLLMGAKEARFATFFPFIRPFFRRFLNQLRDANLERLRFFKKAFIEDVLMQQRSSKAAAHQVLEAHQKGEISEDTLLYLIQNINVAAIDTTVWAMEWGIAELVNNRLIQQELRNELDTVLGIAVPLTEPDLARLPYLQAVVKELLRRHMVIPMLLPHGNQQWAQIGKYDIPAGSKVWVNASGMANDPMHWDKPEEFDPKRFLALKAEMSGNDMRFIPFGAGRRSCPGMNMAVVVLSLLLGRMVQQFTLLPPPGEERVSLKPVPGLVDAHILAEKSKIVLGPRNVQDLAGL